jgi:hypothetical protein
MGQLKDLVFGVLQAKTEADVRASRFEAKWAIQCERRPPTARDASGPNRKQPASRERIGVRRHGRAVMGKDRIASFCATASRC